MSTKTMPRMMYFEQEDILHLAISDEAETNSVELSPNITVELNEKDELIGIEIIGAGGAEVVVYSGSIWRREQSDEG